MLRPEDCVPGTLVECIDDRTYDGEAMPVVLGRVYVVRETAFSEGQIWVRVDDAPGFASDVHRYGFVLDVFRLLPDERLSIFRAMLAPSPKQTETV